MSAGPRVRCDLCGEILRSRHRHHFVTCLCGNLSVDGGGDCLKVSARDHRAVTVLPDTPAEPLTDEEAAGVSNP
jgi:hypothetical protein